MIDRNIKGNAEMRIIRNDTFIYRKIIQLFVNIFRRQATTPVLPFIRIKYGDSQWIKIKGKNLNNDQNKMGFPTQSQKKRLARYRK